MRNNILVRNNRASPAERIEKVRDVLGVRASDNLRHAELVLIVEGEDDRIALEPILRFHSETLKRALDEGALAVDTLSGGSNLAYKITQVRHAICSSHVFLDDDVAGRDAYEHARRQGLVVEAEVNFAIKEGSSESELEDLYDTKLHENLLWERYRVSTKSPRFKSRSKWSDRIKACFHHCGKQWNQRVEAQLKTSLASAVAEAPDHAIEAAAAGPIDGLVASLEERVRSKGVAQQ